MDSNAIKYFLKDFRDVRSAIQNSTIDELVQVLQPDEILEKAITTMNSVVIFCTSTRLLIVKSSFLGSSFESEYLNTIYNLIFEKGIIYGKITLIASKARCFDIQDKTKGLLFVEHVNAKRNQNIQNIQIFKFIHKSPLTSNPKGKVPHLLVSP